MGIENDRLGVIQEVCLSGANSRETEGSYEIEES